MLQGDFALELDRRHVGRSREMLPYNEWLSGRLAELIAEAAESLTERFPSQAGVVAAFAVTGHSTGFGEHVAKCCLERLKQAQFVPTVGAGARKPTDVSLVCDSLGQTANAHQFLDLSQKPDIVMATVEANPQGRKLLAEHLGAPQLSIHATLQLIREPRPDEDQAFYEWLIEWSGRAHFFKPKSGHFSVNVSQAFTDIRQTYSGSPARSAV